jgi:transposase-like protein
MPESHACPHCASRRVVVVTSTATATEYRCDSCGKTWTTIERDFKPPKGGETRFAA